MDLRDMGKPGNQGSLGVMEAFVDLQGRGLWGHLESWGTCVFRNSGGSSSIGTSRKSAGFYILVHSVQVFEDFVTGSGACHL